MMTGHARAETIWPTVQLSISKGRANEDWFRGWTAKSLLLFRLFVHWKEGDAMKNLVCFALMAVAWLTLLGFTIYDLATQGFSTAVLGEILGLCSPLILAIVKA